jgi:hypothetical protein
MKLLTTIVQNRRVTASSISVCYRQMVAQHVTILTSVAAGGNYSISPGHLQREHGIVYCNVCLEIERSTAELISFTIRWQQQTPKFQSVLQRCQCKYVCSLPIQASCGLLLIKVLYQTLFQQFYKFIALTFSEVITSECLWGGAMCNTVKNFPITKSQGTEIFTIPRKCRLIWALEVRILGTFKSSVLQIFSVTDKFPLCTGWFWDRFSL